MAYPKDTGRRRVEMFPFINVGGVQFISFSVALMFAAYVPLFMMADKCREHGLSFRQVMRAMIVSAPFVGLGGKLLFFLSVVGRNNGSYGYLFGGFVFYGGLIGFFAGLLAYVRYTGQSFSAYANFLVPYIALGQSIGRIGCFMNGCCYGAESDWVFAVRYPAGHPTRGAPVIPTPIIESLTCLLLSIFLFKRRRGKMDNFTAYILIYSVLRFTMEFWRGDTIRGFFGPLSTSQWVSLALLAWVAFHCKKSITKLIVMR
jgi:phosphatidylglycerol:prolipoprotein diacylglycerol transferase